MDKPIIVNYSTKLCADILQPLFDMTWDGLGESPIPTDVRAHIQAQPQTGEDGVAYAGKDNFWVEITPALVNVQWGDIGNGNPVSDQTDLVAYLEQREAIKDAEHIGLIIALG